MYLFIWYTLYIATIIAFCFFINLEKLVQLQLRFEKLYQLRRTDNQLCIPLEPQI
jgi:hypothetical protein